MITLSVTETKFTLGQVVITANAAGTISPKALQIGLRRHVAGDWGDVCPEDAHLNDIALEHGSRLLSVYAEGDERFWIITEADRSVTTVLLPEDY